MPKQNEFNQETIDRALEIIRVMEANQLYDLRHFPPNPFRRVGVDARNLASHLRFKTDIGSPDTWKASRLLAQLEKTGVLVSMGKHSVWSRRGSTKPVSTFGTPEFAKAVQEANR